MNHGILQVKENRQSLQTAFHDITSTSTLQGFFSKLGPASFQLLRPEQSTSPGIAMIKAKDAANWHERPPDQNPSIAKRQIFLHPRRR
jgi:hypothetical protein